MRVVDAFCGSGGLGLGIKLALEAAGHPVEFAAVIDTDASAVRIHEYNLGATLALAIDASKLVNFEVAGRGASARFALDPTVRDGELKTVGHVDMFVAGPPCQGHSNLNNYTRRRDPRNEFYVTAVAMGIALGANTLLIENVPTVLNSKTDVVNTAIALLRSKGYGVSCGLLKASALGAAQSRTRHFLMAVKERVIPWEFLAKHAERFAAPSAPLSWAIGDLIDGDRAGIFDSPPRITPVNAARVDYLFDHCLHDLPDAQRPPCHQNGTSYKSVYGRLHWEKPAQTITTGFGTPGQGRYIHALRRRLITPHEAARIQGFPDWYNFSPQGGEIHRKWYAKWIGDAVHPIMGYVAGLAALCAREEASTVRGQSRWSETQASLEVDAGLDVMNVSTGLSNRRNARLSGELPLASVREE